MSSRAGWTSGSVKAFLNQYSIEIIIPFLTLLGETAVPEGKSRLEKNPLGSSNRVTFTVEDFLMKIFSN